MVIRLKNVFNNLLKLLGLILSLTAKMVKMFPTCFDHTLQHLSFLEKHPPRSQSLTPSANRIREIYQTDLRFFRMLLWCIPDCDANLLADFNFIATSIAELYKLDRTHSLALTVTEYNQLVIKVNEKLNKCYAEVRKDHYRQHLISSSSLKAEPFTSNETMEFLDSVHVTINDLLKRVGDGFPTVKSQLETLGELVFLLRNLVYYTPLGGENYDESFGFCRMFLLCFSLCDFDANPQTNLIFQFNVHDWANKAACFSLFLWLTGRQSKTVGDLYIDLQQEVDPCNPDFIKLCFENIKVPKMKRVDTLLFGEFVSRFVDFFLENLILILNDDIPMVQEGLIFIITFLADPPSNNVNDSELPLVREQIYAVLDLASDFFCETNMDLARGKTILDDFLKSIDEVRGNIVNLYVHIPPSLWSNFPKIDRLGYFEWLLAYLENLKETMDNNRKLVPFLKHQFFTIQEELLPLRSFLQDTSTMQNEHNGLKVIWEQIMSLLYQADFAIKSSFFIDDTIWYNMTCLSFVIRKIKDIRYEVMNIKFDTQTEGSDICRTESIFPFMSSTDVPKSPTSTSIVDVVVGFEKETNLLIDRLECGSAQLDIVSIVGMGGIGKTTLAKKLYNEPSVRHHFHKRAFCSVSQVYRKRNVLLDILSDISLIDDQIHQMNDDDLANRLRQSLLGYRYLIVVDDIWDIDVWFDLRASFPDAYNGSRVIFTTRINSISLTAKPDSTPCLLPYLSVDESLELLQQKIFHKDPCPPHLLEVGKLIAKNCRGLPLAIVVIAGLLARTERSLPSWNEVAKTLSSFASSEGYRDIIKLSYKHLPEALKSCFLYLGAFSEDYILDATALALLWVAEGFVLKSGNSCLHKIAKKYLNDLGDRNLVTVTKRSHNGGIKGYRVHDLIRDFCRTEAQEEHYMCYANAHNENFLMSTVLYQHRICIEVEWRSFVDAKPRGPTVHSLLHFPDRALFLSTGYFEQTSLQSFLQNFKLVQVLDLIEIQIGEEFPVTVTKLVHLRYLALRFFGNLYVPPDISNLWNLETLILFGTLISRINPSRVNDLVKKLGVPHLFTKNCVVRFVKDIWKMKRLRHVEVVHFAYVALDDVTGVFSALPDLKTFNTLYIPHGETGEELLRRLSNVRKLKCDCQGRWDPHLECSQLPKLEILTKLESLTMFHTGEARPRPPFRFSLPSTIRKLTLRYFKLPWSELSAIIAMLPCLEVLGLHFQSCSGKIWNVEDEEFPNIKSLTFISLDIEEWNASIDSFPSLEKLDVSFCSKLIEIPPCFSQAATLKYIQVCCCKKRVADSAIQIQKDQFDSGNESFEVVIDA